jgi:hypothetical protein
MLIQDSTARARLPPSVRLDQNRGPGGAWLVTGGAPSLGYGALHNIGGQGTRFCSSSVEETTHERPAVVARFGRALMMETTAPGGAPAPCSSPTASS